MAKFAGTTQVQAPAKTGPTSIGPNPTPTVTFEGGRGYIASDAHVALFNAAVSGLLADQFYETGADRVRTLQTLVPQCDPKWLVDFIAWLRDGANLRSASIVIAAEYARAFPNQNARQVVASAILRADEPAEMLGYWRGTYGRSIPAAVKRGIADSLQRVYNENALLRYDGQNRDYRFGDVIEIVHPRPKADWQGDLFKFALDRRRHPETITPETLAKVRSTLALDEVPKDARTDELFVQLLGETDADMSWERASTWLGRPLNKTTWEALVPTMGYMALLRNLRNFEQAGVDPYPVIQRLIDPEQVQRSRALPFRFVQAYRNIDGDVYRPALQTAADLALVNLPLFKGHSLILVDRSISMNGGVGEGRSSNPLSRSFLAGFYGEALARRSEEATIYAYNDGHQRVDWRPSVPLLRAATNQAYRPAGGTETWHTVRLLANPSIHDQVIIITDEQTRGQDPGTPLPIITWNVAGYGRHQAEHGTKNRFYVGGYSDTALQTLPSVIAFGTTGRWPWEQA
jgi:hypothetical protein